MNGYVIVICIMLIMFAGLAIIIVQADTDERRFLTDREPAGSASAADEEVDPFAETTVLPVLTDQDAVHAVALDALDPHIQTDELRPVDSEEHTTQARDVMTAADSSVDDDSIDKPES